MNEVVKAWVEVTREITNHNADNREFATAETLELMEPITSARALEIFKRKRLAKNKSSELNKRRKAIESRLEFLL